MMESFTHTTVMIGGIAYTHLMFNESYTRWVPCRLLGFDNSEADTFRVMVRHYAGENTIIDIEVTRVPPKWLVSFTILGPALTHKMLRHAIEQKYFQA